MENPREQVEQACSLISRQVQEIYPEMTLHFVVHGTGQLRERITLSEHEVIRHRAGDTARTILQKVAKSETSSFLGMAVAQEKTLLGLSTKDHIIALFTVNANSYEDLREARANLYHLVWHALDLMDIRKKANYKRKFKSGPMIPKRSPMNLARANLQADVFAAVMCGLNGDSETLNFIASLRGRLALKSLPEQRAEDYPFIIALEACQFAYSELERNKIPRSRYIETARQMATEVGMTFDEASVRQWWAFSEPAQDMAWRGHTPAEILGAAVYTSEDPYVRATGYLVSEVTGIEPARPKEDDVYYNAFANQERNRQLHRERVDSAFEEAILLGLEEESARPILDVANEQNEHLTEGRIIGWCASALQAAAKAFESAIAEGASPGDAARVQFEDQKMSISWDAIKDLGDSIVEQRRQGVALTLGHVAEICNENPAFAPVLSALKVTMNDPNFVQKLQASNDLAFTPKPGAPEVKGPAPKDLELSAPTLKGPELGPVPHMGPRGPSLGGNRAAHLLRQRQAMQKAKENADGNNNDENRDQ